MGKYLRCLFECVLWICWCSVTLHTAVRAFVRAVGVGVKVKKVLPLVENDVVQERKNVL